MESLATDVLKDLKDTVMGRLRPPQPQLSFSNCLHLYLSLADIEVCI